MTDYQIISIILAVLGLLLTALSLGTRVLIEWIKDKTSKKQTAVLRKRGLFFKSSFRGLTVYR